MKIQVLKAHPCLWGTFCNASQLKLHIYAQQNKISSTRMRGTGAWQLTTSLKTEENESQSLNRSLPLFAEVLF